MRILLALVLLAPWVMAACAPLPGQAPPTQALSDDGNPAAAAYPTRTIQIMAPVAPGGGWDLTARAMQPALSAISGQSALVTNVAGGGGTVGLAQFVDGARGDPHELMVGGLAMIGTTLINQSPVTLDQVTPIATLTTEWAGIAVAADSQYQTFEQLIEDFKATPSAISWGGGSAGGTDHILVAMMARAAGVDPSQINYVAHSGGGEAIEAILSGAVTAGVSNVSEFQDQVETGAMRYLAVSSEEPIEGIDAPTIREAGLDVELANWRSVFGPPDLTPAERAAVIALVRQMHESREWQQALASNGWMDYFRTGDDFGLYLRSEWARIEGVLRDIGLVP